MTVHDRIRLTDVLSTLIKPPNKSMQIMLILLKAWADSIVFVLFAWVDRCAFFISNMLLGLIIQRKLITGLS